MAHHHTVPGRNPVCPSSAIRRSPDDALLGRGREVPRSHPESLQSYQDKSVAKEAMASHNVLGEHEFGVFLRAMRNFGLDQARPRPRPRSQWGFAGKRCMTPEIINRTDFVSSSGRDADAKEAAWLRAEWASTRRCPRGRFRDSANNRGSSLKV
jgi:hypothetical protein